MFESGQTVLLVIDVQGRLAALMHECDDTIHRIQLLIKAARILDVPVIFTEQVPEKIGKTVPAVAKLFAGELPIAKSTFSCAGSPEFLEKLESTRRRQVLVCGIETHVCVYQTVRDLLGDGRTVAVAADAVSSRSSHDKAMALERIKSLGAALVTCEMIVCELLQSAEHPRFKEVLSLIK